MNRITKFIAPLIIALGIAPAMAVTVRTIVGDQIKKSNTAVMSLPSATDTLVGRASTDTLTNKTIAVGSNSITGTASRALELNGSGVAAASSVTTTELGRLSGIGSAAVGISDSQTLTNKTINGSNNTITNVSLATGTTGTLGAGSGGTGRATLTANYVLLGNGTDPLQMVAPGTSGNVLTSNGTTWESQASAGGGATITDVASDAAITFGGAGTTTNHSVWSWRVNDCLFARGHFTTGTVAASTAALVIGGGRSIDTAKLSSTAYTMRLGDWHILGGASFNLNTDSASGHAVLTHDGSSTTQIEFTRAAGSNAFTSQNGNTIWSNSAVVSFETGCIPISGW